MTTPATSSVTPATSGNHTASTASAATEAPADLAGEDDRASEKPPAVSARIRKLFETESGVILLADVSSVQCYAADPKTGAPGPVCQVWLRSGVTFFISFPYSRALIEAVRAHYL
ncbi:MAG: hypothetical protein V4515_12815 [Chloroflexota bacterium]